MANSFGVVEDKLREAELFLDLFRKSSRLSFEADCFFSAFVSAARSVTLSMQASLKGVPGFDAWYDGIRNRLKTDPLAPFFIEIRNDVVHTGANRLNRVSLEHLREDLSRQLLVGDRSHILVLPDSQRRDASVLADSVEASTLYFASLVAVVYDCYQRFKTIVDPRWYLTEENFNAMNRTFEEAIVELGFSSSWASCAPAGPDAWRALRSQQPPCLINDVFDRCLGKVIPDPDE